MTGAFSYRRDIQGLRAFAVVAVVLFHFFPSWLPGGFVGVDVFFVISGFLIATIILRDIQSGSFRITEFYFRRIRRIFPALLLVLNASIVYGWYFVFPSDYFSLGKQVLGATLFVSNFFFYFDSGYFAGQQSNLTLLHLWSLGVEEQFYLIFPIMCVLLASGGPKRLAYIFGAVALLSVGFDLAFLGRDSSFSFYMPVARFWEFFFGIYVAVANVYFSTALKRLNSSWRLFELQGFIGIIILLVAVRFIKPTFVFPGLWPVLPCLGAALIILAPQKATINRFVLSNRLGVFLGTISYPLYLWHWPILIFAKQASYQNNFSLMTKAGLLLLAVLLASLTYLFVERPISKVKGRSQRRNMILVLCSAMLLVGVFAGAVQQTDGFKLRFGPKVAALDHDYSKELTAQWASECFLERDKPPTDFSPSCDHINLTGQPSATVLIWGDSHAADLIPGLIDLVRNQKIGVAMFTSSFCPPVLGLDQPTRPFCRRTNDFIFEKITRLKPDKVILSADWILDSADEYAKLSDTILKIKAEGVGQVIVIGPAPQWRIPAVALLERELRKAPGIEPPDYQPSRDLDRSFMDEVDLQRATSSGGAWYVSLTAFLCRDSGCLVKTGPGWQNIITFDTNHFTVFGSKLVAAHIGHDLLD